jgi:serine protease Do
MKVSNWGALAGAVVLAAVTAPAAVVHAQSRDTVIRSLDVGRGSRIGATVSVEDAVDNKDARAGVSIDTVEPGGPADKAGIKTGDAVTEFDGERVRSVRQFLRLVQETTPGRSVPVVLSRGGQRVTVNVTPERASFGDEFGMRYFDGPLRLAVPTPMPPQPPAAPLPPGTPRAPRVPRAITPSVPFELFGRIRSGRLGITTEALDTQLAQYFGVKEGVLVKSVVEGSAAAKAGLKAGDVITSVNGRQTYDTSDVTRALDRIEDNGDFTLEVTRDRKAMTLKGKLENRETTSRTRVRTSI